MRPLSCITLMRQEHTLHTQPTKMILTFKAQKTMENKNINSHAQDTTAIHPNVFLTGIHCSRVSNRQWSDFSPQNNCQCPSHQDSYMAINFSDRWETRWLAISTSRWTLVTVSITGLLYSVCISPNYL